MDVRLAKTLVEATERRPSSDELKQEGNFLAQFTQQHGNSLQVPETCLLPFPLPFHGSATLTFSLLSPSAVLNSLILQDLCICAPCCLAGSSPTPHTPLAPSQPLHLYTESPSLLQPLVFLAEHVITLLHLFACSPSSLVSSLRTGPLAGHIAAA